MHRLSRHALHGALLGLIGLSGPALATNGYFAHGYGTKNNGMAGAGVALPQDAMAAATNPAGMVWVGNRMDFGAALFSPDRSYTASGSAGVPDGAACGINCPFEIGPQSINSDNDLFLIPHFARNWSMGGSSSFGFAVYGNGGMNTEYKGGTAQHNDGLGNAVTTPGTYGAGTTGVDLMQLFIAPTYSRKISDTSSWGASAIIAVQRFKADGLGLFGAFGFSSDPNNLTNRGADTSYGAGLRLGWQGEISSGVTLGASYTTEIAMSEFDKYKGLFAEQGDFDIPATATVGIAWKTSPASTLTFDIQEIWYSDIKSIANPIMPNLMSSQLGNADGAGFGWRDMTVYKFGYQWQTNPQWTWRVGISQTDQPIPSSEVMFNILAPGVQETHVTAGFTFAKTQDSEINFAVMYSPESKVSGGNPLDPAQTIELKMDQWQLEASWGWKF